MTRAWLLVAALALAPATQAAPFDPVIEVLRSPRCMNCHTNQPFPRQTDAETRHAQNVSRGHDDRGVVAMTCDSCHGASNFGRVPGAPNWHLAPLSMGWEGLTDAQVCRNIKDPAHNGRRTGSAVIEHMRTDPLVLWAWNPGADRKPPGMPHERFVAALEAWLAAGMSCPAR